MTGRRGPWPEPLDPASVGEHTHRLPKPLRVVLVALVVAVIGLTAAVTFLLAYILDVREYRNQQLDVIREQIRQGNCDLLDQFPEGGLLDPAREKYGCGPGIPLDAYPPEIRDQLAKRPDYTTRSYELLPERTTAPTPTPVWPDTGSAPNN